VMDISLKLRLFCDDTLAIGHGSEVEV
jgi:hypothetical protein